MRNLTYENLLRDSDNFKLTESDSYIESYAEFLNYFKSIEEIEKHHLVIASHFVYGWMPTIIQLDTKKLVEVLNYLNAAKAGYSLAKSELEILKRSINNSIVGCSKLLHFINPEIYAIWDSRIFRYITGNKTSYGIDKVENYLQYLKILNDIKKHPEYSILHAKISTNFTYEISPMRAIEILMFETDRERNRKQLVGHNAHLIVR